MTSSPPPRNPLNRLAVAGLLSILQLYRWGLSPFFGRQCRFQPTCSVYAQQALQDHGIVTGLCLTLNRLRRCHPIRALGAAEGFSYDPVPGTRASRKCKPHDPI